VPAAGRERAGQRAAVSRLVEVAAREQDGQRAAVSRLVEGAARVELVEQDGQEAKACSPLEVERLAGIELAPGVELPGLFAGGIAERAALQERAEAAAGLPVRVRNGWPELAARLDYAHWAEFHWVEPHRVELRRAFRPEGEPAEPVAPESAAQAPVLVCDTAWRWGQRRQPWPDVHRLQRQTGCDCLRLRAHTAFALRPGPYGARGQRRSPAQWV
jgi:hypothetical protein